MSRTPESKWAFKMMSLIHDNPLRRKFSSPYNTLKAAGLKPGQVVLEIGCGPGFFTIPAANLVTETGMVYALDIHPLAIERVQEKITKERVTNVQAILASATKTELPDQSIDLVFLFGIIHRINDVFEEILDEIYRVLGANGIVSIQKSRPSKEDIITAVERKGFKYITQSQKILRFRKK